MLELSINAVAKAGSIDTLAPIYQIQGSEKQKRDAHLLYSNTASYT